MFGIPRDKKPEDRKAMRKLGEQPNKGTSFAGALRNKQGPADGNKGKSQISQLADQTKKITKKVEDKESAKDKAKNALKAGLEAFGAGGGQSPDKIDVTYGETRKYGY